MISFPVKKIIKIREKYNLSRERIARLLNISAMTLWRWENAISQPSTLARQEINKLLKVVEQLERGK